MPFPDARHQSGLQAAARLLGVNADGLLRALTTRTRHTHDGESDPGLNSCSETGLEIIKWGLWLEG